MPKNVKVIVVVPLPAAGCGSVDACRGPGGGPPANPGLDMGVAQVRIEGSELERIHYSIFEHEIMNAMLTRVFVDTMFRKELVNFDPPFHVSK